jgi:hypothetical protein
VIADEIHSMSDKESGEARADHSSFIEHLRLVHFTLCLTCFIAIIAVAARSPSSAQRAYDQSNLVLKLQTKWDDGKWLDNVASERSIQNPAFEAKVEASGNPSRSFVFRPPGAGDLRARYRWFAFAKADKGGLTALKPNVGSFANIEDAETIWNMLGEFQYVVIPSQVHDGWMMKPKSTIEDNLVVDAKLNGGAPVAISARTASPTTADLAVTHWFLESDVEEYMAFQGEPWRSAALDLVKNHKATCYFVAIARTKRDNRLSFERPSFEAFLMFPADCKVEKIDLRQLLGNSILPVEFPLGDFKHSFPDASALGKNLKTLQLAELRDYFQAEQDRVGDKVELPLVKLPAESVAYWGTAIIFLLATYWFAVFRDFRLRAKPDDKAWDTPWIGTSSERWSQTLFLATTLLPSCTAAYLIFYGLDRSFGWEFRLLLAVAAFLLVGLPIAGIVLSWWRIQRPASVAILPD